MGKNVYKKQYLLCSSINTKGRQTQRIVIFRRHKLAYSNHFIILSGNTSQERVLLQIQRMGETITWFLNFKICMGISSYPYELLRLQGFDNLTSFLNCGIIPFLGNVLL